MISLAKNESWSYRIKHKVDYHNRIKHKVDYLQTKVCHRTGVLKTDSFRKIVLIDMYRLAMETYTRVLDYS